MKIKNFPYSKELLVLNQIFNQNKQDNLRIVGGAVRNFLLNKEINDFDLSSKLNPNEVIEILKKNNIKYVPTGIKFGTVMAIINDKSFEITSARKDIKTDGRHAIVEYTNDFKIDAGRRDFTFNALYLDFNGNIYDYFNGIDDLKKGIVKFIGEAEERIKEDYLRILRFFRFYCYYGSVLDDKGLKYSIIYKNKLKNLSGERIKSEIFKILISNYPIKTLRIMQQDNILNIVSGIENFDLNRLETFYSIKKYLNYITFSPTFLITLLLKNKEELAILKDKWKLSKKENLEILKLLNYKNDDLYTKKELIRILFLEANKYFLINLIIFNAILNERKINENLSECIRKNIDFINRTEIPTFNITGRDLKKANILNIKRYGEILNKGKKIFIESNFEITKEEILSQLISNYK